MGLDGFDARFCWMGVNLSECDFVAGIMLDIQRSRIWNVIGYNLLILDLVS